MTPYQIETELVMCKKIRGTFYCEELFLVKRDDQKATTGGKRCTACCKIIHLSNFRRHLRTHTGEKPFQCVQCSAAFVESTALRNHMRTHTGEKPLECEICHKRFKGNLRRHLKTHTEEKPYQCQVCQKVFRERDQLQKHGPIHSAERPFKCIYCISAFKTKSNLHRHVKTLHRLT